MKITIAITGASGSSLGLKLLKALPNSIDKHLILSDSAKAVLQIEEQVSIHDDQNIASALSSGSFGTDVMMIVPCSMNTVAKISNGIADNLTTRAASVMIKEHKTLLIAPREMPLSSIALENLLKLSQNGVIIAPPLLAYYSKQQTLEQMESFMVGRWLDLVGVDNKLYKRWGEDA